MPRILLIASLMLVALPATGPAQLIFTDITNTAGIAETTLQTESLAWGDYDNDGDPDLYLTNLGANKLLRNDGGGTFTDVTATAGVGHESLQVGTAWGDLDNDGDLDLYAVTFSGGELDLLYRNDGPIGPGGTYQFTEIADAAGLSSFTSIRGVSLFDYNRDGRLDIYINSNGPDTVYRNDGGMQFTEVGFSIGVTSSNQGVGVVATDINDDGWIDVFSGNRNFQPNQLFRNDAGTLTDITAAAGIDKVGLGMGVLSFDFDNDLDFDLYWTTWPSDPEMPEANALYENQGGAGPTFLDVTAASGTEDRLGWGISCNAGDLDNDGWQDFMITNGADPSSTPSVLFRNDGDKTFSDVTSVLSGMPVDARGVAFADIDGDGDLDLAVTGVAGESNRLWRNDSVNSNRWLTLTLTGTESNRSAIGARIEVTTDLGTTVGEVSGGAGRGSFNDLPVEFGLGTAARVERVLILWPRGRMTVLDSALDQRRAVSEDQVFHSGFENGGTHGWDVTVP